MAHKQQKAPLPGFPVPAMRVCVFVDLEADWCDGDLGVPREGDPLASRVRASVLEAVRNAVHAGEANGFAHDLEDALAVTVAAVTADDSLPLANPPLASDCPSVGLSLTADELLAVLAGLRLLAGGLRGDTTSAPAAVAEARPAVPGATRPVYDREVEALIDRLAP